MQTDPPAPEPVVDITEQFPDATDFADELAGGEHPEGSEAPPEEAPGAPPAPEAREKYRLKINGADEEIELSRAELIAQLQKAKFADQRFSEAGLIEKKSKELYGLFQSDPYAALKAMGHDPEKMAEDLVYAKAKRGLMSAEEQALSSLQEELAALRARDQAASQKFQQQEVAAIEETIVRDIDACLTKNSLPLARELRRQVVHYMAEADRLGYEVGPEDVLDYALADYKASLGELFGGMEAEQLLGFLGAEIATKIRKHDIAAAKRPFTTAVKKGAGVRPQAQEGVRRSYSPEDFLKSL